MVTCGAQGMRLWMRGRSTPRYPFNQLPKSYSFLVKHESLWRMAFHSTKPRFVHQPQMAATSAFVAREMAKMLDKHRPDLIVSVHPLMQVRTRAVTKVPLLYHSC